jgi:hypothetical protein
MCNPAALFAITAATTVAGYIDAASQTAKLNEQAAATKSAAQKAYLEELKQIVERQMEERQSAADLRRTGLAMAREARGTLSAELASMGVAGVSADLLINDVSRQTGEYMQSVKANKELMLRQLEREKGAAGARMLSRIAGIPTYGGPSLLGAGLRIGAGAVQTFGLDTPKAKRRIKAGSPTMVERI